MNYDAIIEDLSSILKSKKVIGLFVSGGFDSAILSFTLHQLREELKTDNVFKFFTVPRLENSALHALRVVNAVNTTFNSSSPHYIVGNPHLPHPQQVKSGMDHIMTTVHINQQYSADIYLFSDTKTPEELPGGPVRKNPGHNLIYQPFFQYTKDETVNIMIKRNLYHVMNLTHTCTESKTLRCNKCWQCRERAWAFNKCGVVDTGTM